MMTISRFYMALFAFVGISISSVKAQEQSFKIGVNSATFFGKPEKDALGNKLENFTPGYGFTGALMTEIVLENNGYDEGGIRFEMTYTRQVFKWRYNGAAYQFFNTQDGKKIIANGTKKVNLELSTNFVKIPVMVFHRFESGLELASGLDLGLLIGGKAKGDMIFKGKTESGDDVPEHNTALKFNYSNDEISTVEFSDATFRSGGQDIQLPRVVGAYYEARKKDGLPFNRYYVGLNGDIAYWIQDRVALRLRGSYNLIDLTNNKNNYLRQSLDAEKNTILRKGYENFFNWQFTVDVRL